MRVVFLIAALGLISISLVAFMWTGPSAGARRPQSSRLLVTGRIKGDFPDHPWTGTVIALGSDQSVLTDDGTFRFAALPGTHILTVCCSVRFQRIYKEITLTDHDLELELMAHPLKEVAGQVVSRKRGQSVSGLVVTASQVGSNVVDRAVTQADGSFALHLTEGDWELAVHPVTLGGERLPQSTLRVTGLDDPSLPLRIRLQW